MLSPLRSLLDVAELASRSHSLLVLLFFVFVVLWWFFVFVCFVFVSVVFGFLLFFLFVVALLVTALWTMYRSMPVQLLRPFSIAYVNALISQFIVPATCN